MLASVAAMKDEDIDVVDIPEAPAENWAFAKRPDLCRPVKRAVTISLDSDVIEWFESHASEGEYQTAINGVLRRRVTLSSGAEKAAKRRRPG